MILKSINLSRYRNYRDASIAFSEGINIISGNNAQGKTNLLEAVFFLSCVKSFRAKKEKDLIQFGEVSAGIEALIHSYGRDIEVEMLLSSNKKRGIKVNGIDYKKLTEYVGLVQSVLFSPDDLNMIKDGPSLRRRFIDIAILQIKPQYIKILSEHNKIIEHKNKIYKNCEKKPKLLELIDVFNIKLSQRTAEIIAYRAEFTEKLNKYISLIFKEMSSGEERINAVYRTDGAVIDVFDKPEENAKRIYDHLCKRRVAEREARLCFIGAHRDDLEIYINDKAAKSFASQGQIRSAVLAMKLAEREIFEENTGEKPILLLDDVLSELDERRRHFLLNSITEGQIFITSCNDNISSEIRSSKKLIVKNGTIAEDC